MMPERAGGVVAPGDGGVRLGRAWGVVLVCVAGVLGDGGVRLGRVVTLVLGRACCVVLEGVDCLVPGCVVVAPVCAGCDGLGRVGVVLRVGAVVRVGGAVVRAGGAVLRVGALLRVGAVLRVGAFGGGALYLGVSARPI